MTAGLAAVQARIYEIQTRFTPGSNPVSNSAAAFAGTLSGVLGARSDSTYGAAATSTGSSGQAVVDIAKQWLGTPYVWGGNEPGKGLDCSGLVQQAYKQLGISLPRVAADQARQGTAVPSLAQAKPGDLVAFGSPVDHIGIYVGDNKMIVAPRKGDVVKIQEVYKTPTAIRRIIPDSAENTAAFSAAGIGALSSSLNSAGLPASLSSQYNGLFQAAGAKYNVSPKLLAAVAKAESGFNANARSGAGAMGLMQLMPTTAKGLGVDPLNPAQAVDGAARMLSGLISKFGSVDLALAGYNAGPNAVTKYGGIPPFAETQNYVRKINASLNSGGNS